MSLFPFYQNHRYMLLQVSDCEKLYLLVIGMDLVATCIIRLPNVWKPNIF